MKLDYTGDEERDVLGALGAKEVGKTALARDLADSGFVAGRYATFSGPDGALLSWAAVFESVSQAERAFERYLDELRSDDGYGLDVQLDAGLGDEGTCVDGDVVLETGPLHESICLWRMGPIVLAAGGPIDAARVRAAADGMIARVP